MPNLLCIDPGSRYCGVVELSFGETPHVVWADTLDPVSALERARLVAGKGQTKDVLVEQVGHYGTGMNAGKTVFDTCVLIGRFVEALRPVSSPKLVRRQSVKAILCGTTNAKDSNVKQACIDYWGGEDAVGGEKCPDCKGKGWVGRGRPPCPLCEATGAISAPGPLYPMSSVSAPSSHAWQALGIATAWVMVRSTNPDQIKLLDPSGELP